MVKKKCRTPLINQQLLNSMRASNSNCIDIHFQEFSKVSLYCMIKPIRSLELSISFYNNDKFSRNNPIIFSAKNAQVLCQLLSLHNNIRDYLSISHALYIGRELMKAELTLIAGQNYIQD